MLAACPFPANHGTPGSIRELTEATAERGHEVHVVCYHMGEDLPLRNVHVHRIADWTGERTVTVGPTRRRPLYDLQMVFRTMSVMRRYRLDLMHAHGYEAALVAACCRPVVRRPVLYSAHTRMGDELASYSAFRSKRLANGLAWALDRTVPRIGTRCLPHSENLAKFLASRGLQDRSEPVLNFGIDFDRHPRGDRHALRREHGFGDEPIVMYSGVMDRFQRLDLLLEAMPQVLQRAPQARLVMLVNVAHQEHEAAIRREAERLGLAERVHLLHPGSLENGLRLLAMADVAVVPRPAAPGFPIKLLNYMAAELPCVMFASSASGIVDRRHALLAPVDTAAALGRSITEALDDDALRQRIARGGHELVRARHDRRQAAATLCQVYQRLLEPTRLWRQIEERPTVRGVGGLTAVGSQSNGSADAALDQEALLDAIA
ncbi:MAG TPA: glycosyltransferase family 4 protein [Lacipirellulaceae bacterium]|nr:glycosyltransferase family 4 protein [Lacipirellulaceae bacterium]